jgi:tetratricopeptide (TPR) repeat protein
VLLLLVTSYLLLNRGKPARLRPTDTIVVAEFMNQTGDPVFDGTLRQGLTVQLQQSAFLGLTSQQRIQEILALMNQPADARLAANLALEVCERAGSAAVLDGSITLLGGGYVLGLRARDCRSGRVLSEQQVQVSRKEDVLGALSTMSSKLRAGFGESLASLEQHNVPLAEAATSSLEALKAYSTGEQILFSLGDAAALPFFKRATEIDPQFAAAHARLGLAYGAIGESALSAGSTARAYGLRGRASDAERYLIVATYDEFVKGNQEQAREDCETWIRAYPRDKVPHALLAGFVLPSSGRYEEAVAEGKRVIELDPRFSIGYTALSFALTNLDRYREAEDALHGAAKLGLETYFSATQWYDLAFLRGDAEGMQQQLVQAQQKAEPDDQLLNHQAFALVYAGRLDEAKAVSRHAAEVSQQLNHRETAALYHSGAAVFEAFAGDASAARGSALAALALSHARDVEYGAAFALAAAGDDAHAQALANDLERRFPENTSVRFSYLPVLRARSALNHHDAARAIQLLHAGAPYDLGITESTAHIPFGAMYTVYLRGQAYLAARRGAEAAIEFQKILDHRGIVISDPVGALARLQLARAYAMAGDREKAGASYRDFLELWKDGDPGVPVLRQAKTEYAHLL